MSSKLKATGYGNSTRLSCPKCKNAATTDIIERRAGLYECRKCGYIEDADMWDKREDIKW